MTVTTQLLEADLADQVPSLLAGTSVVALVPATELRGWAAEMAWSVARAAAGSGRRTVLIDCFVDAPTLHGAGGEANDEGIVDAFVYGASLNRIVRQQPQADLFFIPTGTYASDAEPVMQHPRWKRLSAGFRHEEALLLLYVGAEHLAGLAAEPDGVIVLAPQGLDLAVSDAPALTEAIGRGLPLLAVVADEAAVPRPGDGGGDEGDGDLVAAEPVAAAMPEPAPASGLRPVAEPEPRAKRKWSMTPPNESSPTGFTWLMVTSIALLLTLLAGGSWWLAARREAARAAAAQDSIRLAAAQARQARAVQALPPVESLPLAVPVASLPRLAEAFARADSLGALRLPAMIAPIRVGGPGRAAGRVVYRVYAGPYASAPRADSAIAALRAAGLLGARDGAAARVPLSLDLGTLPTLGAARAEVARLRAAGVPTFVIGAGDGSFRLYAGAYDAATQLALLQDLVTPTGGAGVLAPRTGYVP